MHQHNEPDTERGEHLAPVTYLPGARRAASGWAVPGVDMPPTGVEPRVEPRAGSRSESRSERATARAANVSVHQLARRGMSRWELEQVLAKREIDAETAAAELNRLESVGLLDDAALAVTLVYTQHTRKGLGRTAIAQELRRRHIDPEIIADALAEIDDDDEHERALELAVKRVGQLHSVDDETATRRLTGYLMRKGYPGSVVRAAVQQAMSSRGPSGVHFE